MFHDAFKRLTACVRSQITPPTGTTTQQVRHFQQSASQSDAAKIKSAREAYDAAVDEYMSKASLASIDKTLSGIRLPKAVQATYLAPLRRTPTHMIPSVDLQLRSYSVRNLELFTDFALRAAYYLKLPARGPTPLRRIVERWTVPRSNFVHKKSQENFERKTLRRWIRIVDGHPETVNIWLAFLRKHQYYGVGVKANVYEQGPLEVAADMDASAEEQKSLVEETIQRLVARADKPKDKETAEKWIFDEPFKAAWGAASAMGGAQHVKVAGKSNVQAIHLAESTAAEASKESRKDA